MRIVQLIKAAIRPAGVVIALVGFAAVTNAEQASVAAVQMAKEIVTVTGATALFNPFIPGVVGQAKNLFLQQDPGLGKDLNEIAAEMRTDLAPRFSELTDEMAKLYTTHFTEAELKQLLAFYRSPIGVKLITEQPKVGEESLQFAQDWANKLSDQVTVKMRDELKKRGHQL